MRKIGLLAGVMLSLSACSTVNPEKEPLDAAKDYYSTSDQVIKNVVTHDEKSKRALKNARSRSNEADIYGTDSGTIVGKDLSLRAKSIYEAGMAYGAQESLRVSNLDIQEQIKHYSSRLDYSFNFGIFIYDGVILAPAVEEMRAGTKRESDSKLMQRDVAFVIYDEARIVTTPPTYRDYLVREFLAPKKIHPSLKPKNGAEDKAWREGVDAGWAIGRQQALDIASDGMAKLLRDFEGRVTYRKLVKREMIDPAALKVTQNGVTFNGRTMSVGERILEISEGAKFKNHDAWQSVWKLDDEE